VNTFAKFDAAVGALIVVAVVGVTQLREPAPPAPRSPAPSLSPRPSAPAPPIPTPEPEAIPFPSGPPETWGFPAAGELSPGWYVAKVNDVSHYGEGEGYAFGFNIAMPGWQSGGTDAEGYGGLITKGAVPSVDGAVIRFSSPDSVYTDPCAHTQGPALGHSAEELAAAMAGIPGVDVNGPYDTEIGSSREYPTIAKHVDLWIGSAPACGPGEDGFYLWFNERAGPLTGPRWVTSIDSTIGVWVFHPQSRYGLPRVVIDAETFRGGSPELQQEIQQIVDSITYYGG
jgi:hypothetical protein